MFSWVWRGLDRIVGRLADPRMRKLVAVGFDVLGKRVVYLMRKELADIRYTGALEKSVGHEVSMWRMQVAIEPTAKHTLYVYKGTRPHWAPIAPLKRWAAVKLGDEQAGYAVQRSIKEYGTSVWFKRKHGTMDNPFPERTLKRGDTQVAIRNTAKRLGLDLTARVVG